MHPTTLRLQPELLAELDEEAEETGFNTRSEYIRFLLQNRHRSTIVSNDTNSNTSEYDKQGEIIETVDTLTGELSEVVDRVDELESTVEEIESSLTHHSTDDDQTTHDFDNLEQWLQTDGPQSADAQTVMVDAARILSQEGPLPTDELRTQLYNRHSESYTSAETLWKPTIQRLHSEAPGFEKPAYGRYDFVD